MLVQDASQGEVAHGIFHRWVGLQGHAATKAVEVDACNQRLLAVVVGLLLHNGGEDDDFQTV